MVLNKIDRFEQRDLLRQFLDRFPNSVGVSAKTGEGISGLLSELGAMLRPAREFVELLVPHNAAAAIARLHEVAQVIERDYTGETARFKARIPPDVRREFAAFIVPEVNGTAVHGINGARTGRREDG